MTTKEIGEFIKFLNGKGIYRTFKCLYEKYAFNQIPFNQYLEKSSVESVIAGFDWSECQGIFNEDYWRKIHDAWMIKNGIESTFADNNISRKATSKIQTTIEIITPAKAVEYLAKNVSNRTINKKCVRVYAEDMLSGRWRLNGEPIIFCKDGSLYDGQHRLKACIEANTPFHALVVRGVEMDVYATINCGKPRSASDSLKIYGEEYNVMAASIVRKYIVLCRNQTAVSKAGGGNGLTKLSNQHIIDTYYQHKELVINICKEARICYQDATRVMTASDIGGIMLFLHIERKHPMDFIKDFFYQLCDRKPTEWGQIRYLRKIFIDDSQRRLKMGQQERQAFVVKAWNYYVKKQNVGTLRLKPQFDFNKQFI